MGRESKVLDIAWELKNLWNYLTRKELSDYYGVSERTLYTYSKQLNLPKKIDRATDLIQQEQNVFIWNFDKETNKYKKMTFKNWDHFVVWSKAQSYPITIDSMEKDGHRYVTCKHLSTKIKEAEEYEKQICKNLK